MRPTSDTAYVARGEANSSCTACFAHALAEHNVPWKTYVDALFFIFIFSRQKSPRCTQQKSGML